MLNLSYKNSDGLNKIIDESLPGRPRFLRHEVIVEGEALEFFARDIIECIKALWGDSDLTEFLIVEPERQYTDNDCLIRIYHDINTAKWWWNTQVNLSNPCIVITI